MKTEQLLIFGAIGVGLFMWSRGAMARVPTIQPGGTTLPRSSTNPGLDAFFEQSQLRSPGWLLPDQVRDLVDSENPRSSRGVLTAEPAKQRPGRAKGTAEQRRANRVKPAPIAQTILSRPRPEPQTALTRPDRERRLPTGGGGAASRAQELIRQNNARRNGGVVGARS